MGYGEESRKKIIGRGHDQDICQNKSKTQSFVLIEGILLLEEKKSMF